MAVLRLNNNNRMNGNVVKVYAVEKAYVVLSGVLQCQNHFVRCSVWISAFKLYSYMNEEQTGRKCYFGESL